jgi:MscS family membrane protein
MMTRLGHYLFILLTLQLLVPMTVLAEDEVPTLKEIVEQKEKEKTLEDAKKAPAKGPYDELGRSTPRSSLINLANALAGYEFELAVKYMDLRNLPFSVGEADGLDLARKLLIVGDRSIILDYEAVSDEPEGHLDDGLPKYRDRITTIKTSEGPVDILMQRIPRGDGVYIWKLSNETVARIPALDQELGYGPIGDRLSLIFPQYDFMGLQLWQWPMLIVLLLSGVLFAYVITWILFKAVQIYLKQRLETAKKFINGPLRFLIFAIFFHQTFDLIAPSLEARAFFEVGTLMIIALVWILIGFVDLIMAHIAERMIKRGQANATVLLKPVRTVVKVALVLIGVTSWLDNMGYNVTTLVAGLGIGGVAVAFAAQRSLENLLGSVMIYSSQPVHVGDFCKFGEQLGVVEEIGLRATQLRTLERTVVHIPNAKFSTDIIENLTQRDKILYRSRLRLSLQTTAEQMEAVLGSIRELISRHEMIDEESSRVRFLEFGEYAQEIELYVYIKTRDFIEYLEHREDINLSIQRIIETAGTKLVVPTRTTYLEGSLAPEST